jgi:thiosulfate dehydrogenase [quinone] large subunit
MEIHSSHSSFARFFFHDTRSAWVWLILRVWVGYDWLMAGWGKFADPSGVWVGEKAGVAISGFLNGSLAKMGGEHPNVSEGYGWFIQHVALPNATLFSYMVTYGEILVGLGLIFGLLTGIAAFFGAVMNFNFLFAGTVSTNPYMLLAQIFIILAWRVAGWYGADRKVLPFLRRR